MNLSDEAKKKLESIGSQEARDLLALDGMTVREIADAAEQGNEAAVRYMEKSRSDLLDVLLSTYDPEEKYKEIGDDIASEIADLKAASDRARSARNISQKNEVVRLAKNLTEEDLRNVLPKQSVDHLNKMLDRARVIEKSGASPDVVESAYASALDVLSFSETLDIYEYWKNGLPKETAHRPTQHLSPIDKVTNKIFEPGVLNTTGKANKVATINRAKSRKPVITSVSISTEALDGVQIDGLQNLTAYDREVQDAILTLYVEGGNTYQTINMIYQQMTGKAGAHCSEGQAREIDNAITKLMYSQIRIDASDEALTDHRIKQVSFDAPAINAKRSVLVNFNGQVAEAIKILDTPILYDYAQQKDQICRYDVKLLNTPTNKNKDTLVIEGYLRRRIFNKTLSSKILYETIYEQVDLSGSSSETSALRNKKQKIRETVKTALDYFKKEGAIKDYEELSSGKKKIGIQIFR